MNLKFASILIFLLFIHGGSVAKGDQQSQCNIPSMQYPVPPYAGVTATYNISLKINLSTPPNPQIPFLPLRLCIHCFDQGVLWDWLPLTQTLVFDVQVPRPGNTFLPMRLVVGRSILDTQYPGYENSFGLLQYFRSEDVDYGPVFPGYARREIFQNMTGFDAKNLQVSCGYSPELFAYSEIRWNSGPPSYVRIAIDSVSLTDGPNEVVYVHSNFDLPNGYTPAPIPDLTNSDGDSLPDCTDECPTDSLKTVPGLCGCGVAEANRIENCGDECPNDPLKLEPGICGCGVEEKENAMECGDECPLDPLKIEPGLCGCGIIDTEGCSQLISEVLPPPPLARVENNRAQLTGQRYESATLYEFTLKRHGGFVRSKKSKSSSVKFRNLLNGRWKASYKIFDGKTSSKTSQTMIFLIK